MSQTAYNINQSAAVLGMIASDTLPRLIESKIAAVEISVGKGVTKYLGKDDQVRLPAANKGTLTFAGDLITDNVINLKVNGSAISPVTFITDHATTMGLIAAAIATKTGIVSATVTAARVITVIANIDVALTDIVVTAGLSQTTGTWAGGTDATLFGIALLTQILESGLPNSETTPAYAAEDVVNVLRKGQVYVYFETVFNPDTDTLYLRHTANGTGKEPGFFRNDSDSSKAVAVTGNFAVKTTMTAAGIGILEINKPV